MNTMLNSLKTSYQMPITIESYMALMPRMSDDELLKAISREEYALQAATASIKKCHPRRDADAIRHNAAHIAKSEMVLDAAYAELEKRTK